MQPGWWFSLALLALTHAAVDATCAAEAAYAALHHTGPKTALWQWIVLYNLIAFGTQFAAGLLIDRFNLFQKSASLGCAITALSTVFITHNYPAALILAGIGNSLFHAGAGAISLNYHPGRPWAPGLFVAPGALGIATGTLGGKMELITPTTLLPLLAALCVIIPFLQTPAQYRPEPGQRPNMRPFTAILVLILFSIAIRSYIGLAAQFPWKTDKTLLLYLAASVVSGKALGGILATRFGWIRTGIISLLISAPLISLCAPWPPAAITGMFLFQLTMPITLTALDALMPGRSGFTFGLASLALFAGSYPAFIGLRGSPLTPIILPALTALSAAALYIALRSLAKTTPSNASLQEQLR